MAISRDGPQKIQGIFMDRGVHIPLKVAQLLDALLGRQRLVMTDEIIDRLYGHLEDGGPEYAPVCLRKYVHTARHAITLAGMPWSIEACHGFGYRLRYLQVEDDVRLAA